MRKRQGHSRGRSQGRGQGGRVVADHYYSPNEWSKFSLAQKNKIFKKRGTKRDREVSSVQATAASSVSPSVVEGTIVPYTSVGDQMSRRNSRNINSVFTSNQLINDDSQVVAKMKTMGTSKKIGRAELD